MQLHEINNELLLTIQVSNHTQINCGIWRPIKLGFYEELKREETTSIAIDLFAFGGLFVMGLHYFGIYIHRRKEKGDETEYLIFSSMCFIFAIRTLCVGSRFFFRVFPYFSMELQQKISFLSFYLLPLLFVLFFDRIFPKQKQKPFTRAVLVYFSSLSLMVLFTNRMIFQHTLSLGSIGAMVVCFWLLLRTSRIAYKNRNCCQEAAPLVLGTSILIPTVINDILFSIGFVNTGYFGSLGMLFFLISMSSILSKRFSNAFILIRNQNRELQRLNRVKDHFLANTSHELRTPLHAITGISESLMETCKKKKGNESAMKNLTMIHSSARYLTNLVNDILDTTVLKYQKLKISPTSLNLYSIVQGMVEFHRPLIRKRDLQLINNVPATGPAVRADEFRLRQILQNLLGNAIKYTKAGAITIEAIRKEQFLEISVRDSGVGIGREHFETIFQPFEQLESEAVKKEHGTGLGLYICKELVRLHGGTIRVESNLNQGSTFTFTLPVSEEPAEDQSTSFSDRTIDFGEEEQKEVITAPRKQKQWSVLVVDDDSINLHVVSGFLAADCYDVIRCGSGREALKVIEQDKPDLVLLDLMMPEMDGFEVCGKIREHHSHYDLPVVFLTACNEVKQLIQAFEVGGNDYLTKPFSKTELMARVTPLLERKGEKKRINALRTFSNQIGSIKNEQAIFLSAFRMISQEPYISSGSIYKSDTLMESFHDTCELIKPEFTEREKEKECIHLEKNGMKYLSLQVSEVEDYSMVFRCRSTLNEVEREYINSIIDQVKIGCGNIQPLTTDPKSLAILHEIASQIDQILFIQAADNYCTVHKKGNKTAIIRMPLKKIKLYFDDDYLLQVHRSYLINPNKIKGLRQAENRRYFLEFTGKRESIPVGRKYKSKLETTIIKR